MMMLRSSVVALVALLATSSSDAFFVGSAFRAGSGIAYESKIKQPRFSPRVVPSTTPTAASRSLMAKKDFKRMVDFYSTAVWIARPDLFLYDRLARVAWDNLSKNWKKIESENTPENVLNRALAEMQNDLNKIQQAYEDVTDTQRRMAIQKGQAEGAAQELYRRAQYALSRGFEESARDALSRRQQYLEAAKKLQVDIDAQDATREKLYEAIQALQEKFREELAKKHELIVRAKTAESVKKANDMLSGVMSTFGKKSSDEALASLERKVEVLEAAAEASSSDILGGKAPALDEATRVEMEFARLEDSAAVDDEMEKMARELKSRRRADDWARVY